MPDLERRLTDLGAHLEWPPEPDVRPALRARLADAPRPAPRRLRPLLVLVAVAVTLVAGLAASPEARSAILRLLRLRGATVEQVDRPPAGTTTTATPEAVGGPQAGVRSALTELGEAVTLTSAGRRAGFAVPVPAALGEPDAVRLAVPAGGPAVVSLLYGPRRSLPPTRVAGVGLLATAFRGSVAVEFLGKLAGPGTRVERVSVDGASGVWLEGEPHFVFHRAPDGSIAEGTLRLSENTLLWEHGELLLRIESRLGRDDALRVAGSFEP